MECVQEIAPLPVLTRLPGQTSLIVGFLNLRGTAVAVISISRLFDLPPTQPGLYTPLVILRGSPAAALLVDRVRDIITVSQQALLPVAANTCFNDCATAELETPEGAVHVLDGARLLLEEERRAIEEIRGRAQRYIDEAGSGG